jgi:hypothetical protein
LRYLPGTVKKIVNGLNAAFIDVYEKRCIPSLSDLAKFQQLDRSPSKAQQMLQQLHAEGLERT